MASTIIGRDAELASIRDFVARVADGPTGLVLEGEAGAGKTTLWRAAVEQTEAVGALVLEAQPVESETTLSLTGIADLLDLVLREVLERLSPVQRRVLSQALVLEDDDGASLDPRALRVAVLNALRALAEDRPVVVAIDDSQWLDYASSAALAFSLRRLRSERVSLLLARRTELQSVLLDELLRSPVGERFDRVDVGSLDPVALGRVVREQLGAALPRPLLLEVHSAAGGNPFFALEIVRMLRRTGFAIEAGQPIPLPESLHDLVQARINALPPESRDFLLAAAAHAHPTVATTEAASGVAGDAGLGPALAARVVELDGSRIRFTHPLLVAGVYQGASRLRRLEVHRRLAKTLDDPEARAWQLAAATDRQDEAVAAALEEAARHARGRGAPRPAALLLDRASELTPRAHRADARRRAVEAAYLHYESGDSARARRRLEQIVAEEPPGVDRARALVRLARVRSYEAQREAVELFREAIGEAGADRHLLAIAHEGVAACLFRLREGLAEAVEHAATAARLAAEIGDRVLEAEAVGSELLAEGILGHPSAPATAERALELQDAASEHRVIGQPLFPLAVYRWWTGDVTGAHEALLGLRRRSEELGDESSLPYLLVMLGWGECLLGELEAAGAHAAEGQEVATQTGQRTTHVYCVALESLVAAHCGEAERARTLASAALEHVAETGGRPAELLARAALGQVELASGAAAAAYDALAPAVEHARAAGFREPMPMWFVVDGIEALAELGRREEALELLDWYEENARALDRPAAIASCLRCRGLLAAADGRVEEAIDLLEEAAVRHGEVELPLERGRTLMALGAAQRRAKHRRAARQTLEEALAVFERIGALLWAERARGELRRISGRAPAPDTLTPAEEKVAALVCEGKTNREVAAALFLSERTVEGHLSRVFGKLGVRHRTEVAAALAARQTRGVDASNTGDSPVSAGPVAP